MNFQDLIAASKRFREGAKDTFSHGREDYREALKRGYVAEGRETDGSRINQMLGSNRTISTARELMGVQGSNPNLLSQIFQAKQAHVDARESMGLGLSKDPATRAGQFVGTMGSDLVQDRGRELWWLINAPQALASVTQELLLHKHAPDLFAADIQNIPGTKQPITSNKTARLYDLVDERDNPKAGVSVGYEHLGRRENGVAKKDKVFRKRRHPAGLVNTLIVPSGLAINTGIGLMTPFGGAQGYKAVFEDPEDPSKTDNVVGEVAAKYILGKTGNLLPWDEFQKVRPDVSKDEYMRYKAFKFDNEGDLNPFDDGKVALPTGVLKGTTEGIHGPEVQFLGRSLPLTTALLPTAASMVGTTLGARGPKGSVGRALLAGLGGAVGGQITGNLLEQERRRRNAAQNGLDTIN